MRRATPRKVPVAPSTLLAYEVFIGRAFDTTGRCLTSPGVASARVAWGRATAPRSAARTIARADPEGLSKPRRPVSGAGDGASTRCRATLSRAEVNRGTTLHREGVARGVRHGDAAVATAVAGHASLTIACGPVRAPTPAIAVQQTGGCHAYVHRHPYVRETLPAVDGHSAKHVPVLSTGPSAAVAATTTEGDEAPA